MKFSDQELERLDDVINAVNEELDLAEKFNKKDQHL